MNKQVLRILERLIARKRFLPTEQSLSYLVNNSRKLWKDYKGLISLIIVRLAIIISVLGGLTKIIRCERKSTVGNSKEFFSSESLRNVSSPFPFSIFHKCLNAVLGFWKELWHCEIICSLWKRNKLDTKGKKKLWSFGIRPILAKTGLRNLRLGNVFGGTFSIRSGNTTETFLAGKRSGAYLRLFSDLCASCHVKLRSYTINLEFGDGFKIIYSRIYLYICDLCRCLLSCKWASYPGALAVKMYTLVYFSSKVSLLMIKSYDKNQSINLIGLAHVEKATSRNRLFLGHNRPYWRELRPLVTPWAWCIKEGTDPWRIQKRVLLSHDQVSLLPLSLSSPSLALPCFYDAFIIIIIIDYVYLLVKGIITVTDKPGPEYSKSLRYKPRHINSKDTLTFIISTASLSLSSQMAIVYGQAISHIQYRQLGSLHYIGAGYLTFIISTASLSLSLFPNGHCIWEGYLPYSIPPAGIIALYRCRLSHLYNINRLALSSLSLLLVMADIGW